MTAGIGAFGMYGKLWVLTDLDRDEDYVGQFIPQSVSRTVGANLARMESVGQAQPFVQWVSGELDEITFTAKLWAKDYTDYSLEERLKRLEALVRKDDKLGRPPICTFSWGAVEGLLVNCLVRSVGEQFDEIRNDGTLRGVSLQLTLSYYEPVEFSATDPSKPERMTRIRRAKRGDTYESIALDEYGNPLLGVLLRQKNPRKPYMKLADLNPLDPVHIFPEEYLLRFPIQPEFHAFRSGIGYEAAEERRREVIEARSGDRYLLTFRNAPNGEFT